MIRGHKVTLFIALLLILFQLLSIACSKAAPTPATTPAMPSAQGTSPTPAQIVKPDGELRIALSSLGNEALDPMLGFMLNRTYLLMLYDSLVGMDDKGGLSTKTGLAESWEMSADGMTWTFRLRKGVKFHNGDEITAEDVKFHLEKRVMGPAAISVYAGTLKKRLKSVDATDRYTVVMQTSVPSPTLALDLSSIQGVEGMITPKSYIEEKGDKYFLQHPVGTGPYRFAEQVTGSYIALEAIDKHWRDGIPKYKKLLFLLAPQEASRVAMLKAGEADIVEISSQQGTKLKEVGFNVFLKEGASILFLVYNQQWDQGPLRDKRVREALILAINREEILKALFLGNGKVIGEAPTGSWGLGYENLPGRPYDIERAKRLLTEAGYPNGFDFDIYSYPHGGISEWPDVITAVASYWSKVGVRARIIPTDYAAFRSEKWQKFALRGGAISHMAPPNRALSSDQLQALFSSKGSQRVVEDPKMDELIEKMVAALQWDDIEKYVKAIERYNYDNYLIVPLIETGPTYAVNKGKVTAWPSAPSPYDLNIHYLIGRP